MRISFMESLVELARNDESVFLITADLGFGVFEDFAAEFPKQFINVGVAEQNMMGIATGLALEGKKVVTYSIGNFATLRCLEQIRNDACYHEANITIVASGGGVAYGAYGYSHHATEDLAILRALPGMTVVAPSDKWEAGEAIKSLVNEDSVGYMRIEKAGFNIERDRNEEFLIGKARRIKEGKDLTFITMGGIISEVMSASEMLEEQGISSRIVSMHSIKPIDRSEIVAAANDTLGIIVIEEHTVVGGLGGAISEVLMQESVYPGFYKQIGFEDQYCTIVGSQDYLRKQYGLSAETIKKITKELVSSNS